MKKTPGVTTVLFLKSFKIRTVETFSSFCQLGLLFAQTALTGYDLCSLDLEMAATLGGDTREHAADDFHLDENVHAQIYRKKIAQFQSENRHLKELVVRHQAVLKEYQVAYPELKPAAKVDRQQPDGLEAPLAPLPPWIASPDALGPLLAAYDRRVQTLEGKLEAHKMAVEHLKDETTGRKHMHKTDIFHTKACDRNDLILFKSCATQSPRA